MTQNPSACPFCGASVDEDLVVYGGPCPTCFTDIPGEEAPTDPGEEAQAAEVQQETRRSWWKTVLVVGLFAVPLLGGLALVAVWVLFFRAGPELTLMDFDEEGDSFEIELVAAPEPVAEPDPGAAKTAKKQSKGEARLAKVDVPKPAPAPAPTDGFDIGAQGVQRRGSALSQPGDIKTMIFGVMRTEMPKLKGCYEQRLKTREDLKGRWQMKFTVTASGATRAVSVDGLNMADGELEQCIAAKVSRWQFQRITQEQPVQRSISFKPGE